MRKQQMALALAAMFWTAGCGDDGFTGPAVQDMAGEYVVSGSRGVFIFSTDAQSWDLAAEGSEVRLKIHANGTTEGRLYVPAATETAEPLEADLSGRWFVENNMIYFAQNEQNLIGAMEFHRRGNELHAERQFLDGNVRLTLVK